MKSRPIASETSLREAVTIGEIHFSAEENEEREAFLQELTVFLETREGMMIPNYGLDLLHKEALVLSPESVRSDQRSRQAQSDRQQAV